MRPGEIDRPADAVRLELPAGCARADIDAERRDGNAQASANAILGLRDGNRMVCERRKRTGSNRTELHCERYAERMERARGDRKVIDDLTRRGVSPVQRQLGGNN